MNDDDYISDDERALFRAEMSGVKPLKHNEKITQPISIKPKNTDNSPSLTIKPFRIGQHRIIDTPAAHFPHKTVSGSDVMSYHRSGLQHKRRSRLRQGKLPIEATLDLHAHTADQAIIATQAFLESCLLNNYRHVCIIHGKGMGSSQPPVIKNILQTYLRQHTNVVAFHSARPKHGGTGALYILLEGK